MTAMNRNDVKAALEKALPKETAEKIIQILNRAERCGPGRLLTAHDRIYGSRGPIIQALVHGGLPNITGRRPIPELRVNQTEFMFLSTARDDAAWLVGIITTLAARLAEREETIATLAGMEPKK